MNRLGIFAGALLLCRIGEAAEVRLTGDELAAIVQTTFSGTVIHLDRDPAPGKAGSYIQYGPLLGNQRFGFSIPAKRIGGGMAGSFLYQVSDINSNPEFVVPTSSGPQKFGQNIGVKAHPSAYVITVRFEDHGTEVKGMYSGKGRVSRRAAPDVEIDDIFLQIELTPIALPGGAGIGFKPSIVHFFGDIQAGGLAGLSIFGRRLDLVDQLTDYKRTIKESIEREVKTLIDRNIPQVGLAIWRTAQQRGGAMGLELQSVQFQGTNLIVTGKPNLAKLR